jgi:ubiquitin related modifier 1
MRVRVEVGGGLELLCGKQRAHIFDRDSDSAVTIGVLLDWMCSSVVQERVELFSEGGGSVRPGILVLVNDVDWELCGGPDCILHDGDEVVFLSTLHGG